MATQILVRKYWKLIEASLAEYGVRCSSIQSMHALANCSVAAARIGVSFTELKCRVEDVLCDQITIEHEPDELDPQLDCLWSMIRVEMLLDELIIGRLFEVSVDNPITLDLKKVRSEVFGNYAVENVCSLTGECDLGMVQSDAELAYAMIVGDSLPPHLPLSAIKLAEHISPGVSFEKEVAYPQ